MRVLGLDVGDGVLRVAHGEQTFAATRLVRIERIPFDDAGGLAAALARLDAGGSTRVHAALPLQCTTHRLLTLPFRDRGRLARTAPLELLGQLPVEPADVHVATRSLGPCDGGTRVLAVAIRCTERDARMRLHPSAHWQVGALVASAPADGILLLADGTRSALVHRRAGRLVGLRALAADARDVNAIAAEVRWVLRAWDVVPATLTLAGPDAATLGALGDVVDDPEYAVARGLVSVPARDRLLLAGDDTEVAPGWWRRPVALAGAAALLAIVNVALVRADLRAREAALAQAIAATATGVLPDVAPEAARAALEDAAAARRRAGAGDDTPVLEVLREVSTRIPAALALDLDELTVEPEAVVLHGRCSGFDAVDALRRALAASPLVREVTADETRTTVDGTGVEFRLRAVRRTTGGAPS